VLPTSVEFSRVILSCGGDTTIEVRQPRNRQYSSRLSIVMVNPKDFLEKFPQVFNGLQFCSDNSDEGFAKIL